MPRLNQRGPGGQGPKTGRRIGRCNNYGANLKNQNETPGDNQTENKQEILHGRGFRLGEHSLIVYNTS
jgi:hypothetical protein